MTDALKHEVQQFREMSLEFYQDWDYTGEEVMIPVRNAEIRVRIYRPEGQNRPLPVFFDVHGGGWVVHRCEADQPFCEKIADRLGIIAVSIDYRLAPEYKFPTENEDVYDVISYFYQNAGKFRIDPQRMGVGGHSAGGTISLAVAMMAKDSGAFPLRLVILDYPGLDSATPMKDKVREELTDFQKEFLELCGFFERCAYASPEQQRDPLCSPWYATREQLAGLPPVFLTACENDLLKYEDIAFASRLMEAGVEVTAKLYPGVIHGFNADLYYTDEADYSHQLMIDQMERYLLKT